MGLIQEFKHKIFFVENYYMYLAQVTLIGLHTSSKADYL